ncbi:fenitrothion hydrolase [Conexibacter sp. SYSU D00693]|uniref:fenitrothion hydrolase n=1 Tax=Conexibacter sp. SYSU D00693 TaxID=2812560 RepID=UPI00196A2FDA|nr:fenitrothion hydrolase [Conexibacter sp. SYSU D00693]
MTGRTRILAAAALFGAAALATPAGALAHGLVGRQDLPIPRWLFAWGAAVVLVVSFVGLGVLWAKPRLEEAAEHRVLGVPKALEVLAGALGVAAFAFVVYAGFAGTQTPTANLAPTAVYVLFWVGVPVLSLLFGDVFLAFNPWRAIGRAAGWVAGRVGGGRDELSQPLEYPERLGRWPAAIGILLFAWVELVFSERDDPSTLAVLALVYAAFQLVGMALYGVDVWTRRADAFQQFFSLCARISPLRWRDRALWRRLPLAGVPSLSAVPGTVALLCVLIGTTTFDGFSQGSLWTDVAPDLQSFFLDDLGFDQARAIEAAFTIGLVGCVLVVALLYRLGAAGMRTVAHDRETKDLARVFAHSLAPIALAYAIAHYFSLLAYQGQAIGYLASDPLGDGSDWFGTAGASIDYGVVDANGIWYVQVGALVLGHVAGLVLAHDRALVLFGSGQRASRSQMWMLAVMVGFTSLGLWLLSASAQT